MYVLILVFPLVSFLILGFFGRVIGRSGATVLSTSLIGISAGLSFLSFYEVGAGGSAIQVTLPLWFSAGAFYLPWGFLFDSITSSMLVVVLTISFFVHLYSSSYMVLDPFLVRFMSYLSLFTFFMLCLVTSNNYVQMFLGWEGVGLSSYLLINFWFTRLSANKSAIKAVVVNRFGDFSLILALMLTYYIFKSFDYGTTFVLASSLSDLYLTIGFWSIHGISFLSFFVFIGCVGKSAQLGLHTWLPDAMEGPTPVSALIHAATMVTAGVFLLIRFSIFLEFSPFVACLVAVVGGFTALFAGTVGVFQNDLKRVIAYSTCSQLGYMVLACGLSNYSLALFHLLNHAFFKALLFLSAGSVIHALSDEQDMRRMGGLFKLLPFTYVCFLIGSFALMGFSYTTGFYSKDFILEVAYSTQSFTGFVVYCCGLLAAVCTAFYSFRLIYLTFYGEPVGSRSIVRAIHEPDNKMTIPLVVLGLFSIFIGYVLKDFYVGLGSDFLSSGLHEQNVNFVLFSLNSEFSFASEKSFPLVFSLFFSFFACMLYSTGPFVIQTVDINQRLGKSSRFHSFFSKKWYFDQIYNFFIVYPILRFGHGYTFKIVDRGIIELVGPSGLVRFWLQVTQIVSKWQSGYVFNYVFSMVIGLLICIFFVRTGVESIDLRFFMLFVALFVFKNVLPTARSAKNF
jgi:NADH-ubiquinone oxidoreductase chain 5